LRFGFGFGFGFGLDWTRIGPELNLLAFFFWGSHLKKLSIDKMNLASALKVAVEEIRLKVSSRCFPLKVCLFRGFMKFSPHSDLPSRQVEGQAGGAQS